MPMPMPAPARSTRTNSLMAPLDATCKSTVYIDLSGWLGLCIQAGAVALHACAATMMPLDITMLFWHQ